MAKKQVAGNKRWVGQISSTDANDSENPTVARMNFKVRSSIRKTGAHLCYHTPEEYSALSKDQCIELHVQQKASPNEKDKGKGQKKSNCMRHTTKKQLSSVMAMELLNSTAMKTTQYQHPPPPPPPMQMDISSIIKEAITSHLEQANILSNSSTLHSILKKV